VAPAAVVAAAADPVVPETGPDSHEGRP